MEQLREFTVTPEAAGLPRSPLAKPYAAATRRRTRRRSLALLAGEGGAYRDTVLLNAAAGLIVAGRTDRPTARGSPGRRGD